LSENFLPNIQILNLEIYRFRGI